MLMSRHHKGAIDRSNAELSKGTDSTVKQMAQKIIDDSKKEIQDFDNFVAHHKIVNKSDFGKQAMATMESSMSNHSMSGNTDGDFASMMIQHHKDGIDMAKQYLKSGTASVPKKIAANIITNQPRDIQQLENWQRNHK